MDMWRDGEPEMGMQKSQGSEHRNKKVMQFRETGHQMMRRKYVQFESSVGIIDRNNANNEGCILVGGWW